ncbi:MAG TPA: ABC transporter permease, partial [Acidobacteriota bacterium]|nr:ABC transporter permease [Acidobacteriota bacterium]
MMIGNYLKTAWRMIARHKFYSALNVAGLAVGMATVGLILLWVWDEWRYDRFHARADRICRVTVEDLSGGVVAHQAGSPAPLGAALKAELPEVEDFVRVQAGWPGWQLRIGDRYFMDERLAAVDPSFFEIFSFPFLQGDPHTALKNRHSIVITESLARKAFGKENPMGRVMSISDTDMTVTGVIRDIPAQSHLCFDYVFPAVNMADWRESQLDAWDYTQFATYLLLRPGARLEAVREKTARLIRSHLPKAQGRVHLQPLTDVHLGSTDINTWMVKYPDKGNIA